MKKYNKIILAGGSGQLGTALNSYFKDITNNIIILSRSTPKQEGNIRTITWDGASLGDWAKELEGADVIINLAGKNVNCRYNAENRKEIIDSRVNSVKVLAAAIKQCKNPPPLWIQSGSATIYRHAEDGPQDEENGEIGTGFSVEDVCKKWESTFWEETKPFTSMRKVILRISLVLGANHGVLPRLKNLVRFGLGGHQGKGNQQVSWIHEKDVAGIVEWILTHPEMEGILNCTSPYPVTNHEMMKIMRKVQHAPVGLPTPPALLEFGAWLIGTETELILKSRWVSPMRLLTSGYRFTYPRMESALRNILKN